MELEMIMLTEITRNQKGKCHVFLSYAEPRLKFVCVHACVWIRKLEIVHERGRRDIKREKLDVVIWKQKGDYYKKKRPNNTPGRVAAEGSGVGYKKKVCIRMP